MSSAEKSPVAATLAGFAERRSRLAEMSDDEVMQACRHGAREPFKEIWVRYEGVVTNFTQKILGDSTMADEAAHNTFIALWRVRERYEPRERFHAYITRVVPQPVSSEVRVDDCLFFVYSNPAANEDAYR